VGDADVGMNLEAHMRAVATILALMLVLFAGRLVGQTAGYTTPQALGEGAILRIFVEVARPAGVALTLRDADGAVGSVQNKSVVPNQPWLDKVALSRPVRAGSTLQIGVTTTPPVGYRYGVSVKEFQVGVVNGLPRVQGTSAPIIREPVQCTNQVCEVCYTLDQTSRIVFDSYTAKRTIVKANFDPNAPSARGTHVAKWQQWPMDAQRGEHYVVATSMTDGTGAETNSFTLPPGPQPTKCP
jgi:hypothetical protein